MQRSTVIYVKQESQACHFKNVLLTKQLLALAIRVLHCDLQRLASIVLEEAHKEDDITEQLSDESGVRQVFLACCVCVCVCVCDAYVINESA